jgi:acyl-CoA thioesterase-1
LSRLLCSLTALLLAAACSQEDHPPPSAPWPTVAQRLEAGEQLHIVAYGTSLTEFGAWVPALRRTLEERFPGRSRLTNRGHHGVGTGWGLEHLEERVIAEQPDVVLIEFAINDAFEALEISPRESQAMLEEMVTRIEAALPDCEIVLMTTHPTTAGYARRDLAPYYQAVRDLARQRGLVLVDAEPVWRELLEKDRPTFDAYLPDGTHPSPNGDAAITTPLLRAALGL